MNEGETMKKYEVEVKKTVVETYEVEAWSAQHAQEKVKEEGLESSKTSTLKEKVGRAKLISESESTETEKKEGGENE